MMSQLPILLIEDDPGDVRLALSVFRKLHMEDRTVVVNDGEQAMDFLNARGKFVERVSGLPVFILMDLKLPRVNGFDLLRQIRADSAFKYIPVVALTSSRQERDVQLAYSLGVNGYVVKSIDFTEYAATLCAVAKYWIEVNEPPPLNARCQALRPGASAAGRATQSQRALGWPDWPGWVQAIHECFSQVARQRGACS